MRKISIPLQNHINGELTTLATCFKLTLINGKTLGFCDASNDIVIDNLTYLASSGFSRSAVHSKANSIGNFEIEGMLESNLIEEKELLAGSYDSAELLVFMVNYQAPNDGKIILSRGYLGAITIKQQKFIFEVMGLTKKLSTDLGERYSNNCRALFCDKKCKLNAKDYTTHGQVERVESNSNFYDQKLTASAGYYNEGKVIFTTGPNTAKCFEVKEYTLGQVTFFMPASFNISIGDCYQIIAGCNKEFKTCVDKFNNAVNFRGEPHLPGL